MLYSRCKNHPAVNITLIYDLPICTYIFKYNKIEVLWIFSTCIRSMIMMSLDFKP